MSETLLPKVQEIELQILIEVDRICRKHNIRYFLDSGTLLGAVRHGGFIPWDDDIDIGMPREDYERFLNIAPKELPDDLFVQNYETDGAPFMFTKVRKTGTVFQEYRLRNIPMHNGIFIDIFPYDYLPEGEEARLHIQRCIKLYEKFQYRTIPDRALRPDGSLKWLIKAVLRRLTHYLHLPINLRKLVKTMNHEFSKYPESDFLACHSFLGEYCFHKEDLFPCKEIEFEGHRFLSPANTDRFLSELYGDYMKLPPPEERLGHRPYKLSVGLEGEESIPYWKKG